MTTKTDTEQERADFEVFASKHGLCVTEGGDLYRSHVVAWMWKAWQARAALQSQKPEPNNLMLSAVIRMPFEMAMADPISRMQFYQRAQQALNELETLQSQDLEDTFCAWHNDPETDNSWDTSCRKLFEIYDGTPTENSMTFCCYCGKPIQESIDHARRVEGDGK